MQCTLLAGFPATPARYHVRRQRGASSAPPLSERQESCAIDLVSFPSASVARRLSLPPRLCWATLVFARQSLARRRHAGRHGRMQDAVPGYFRRYCVFKKPHDDQGELFQTALRVGGEFQPRPVVIGHVRHDGWLHAVGRCERRRTNRLRLGRGRAVAVLDRRTRRGPASANAAPPRARRNQRAAAEDRAEPTICPNRHRAIGSRQPSEGRRAERAASRLATRRRRRLASLESSRPSLVGNTTSCKHAVGHSAINSAGVAINRCNNCTNRSTDYSAV